MKLLRKNNTVFEQRKTEDILRAGQEKLKKRITKKWSMQRERRHRPKRNVKPIATVLRETIR